jgi:phage-related holin
MSTIVDIRCLKVKRVARVTSRLIRKGIYIDYKMLSLPYSPLVCLKIIIFISNLVQLQILGIMDFMKAFIRIKQRLVLFQV